MARGYGKKSKGGAGKRIKGKKGGMGKAGGMRTFFTDRIMSGRSK